MYPAAFEYHAPASVADALKLLGKLDDAKILAGGHSLIPMMKLRLAQPKHLIDLRKVPGLTGIKEDKGMISIGAMTTHWEVESSKVLKSKCAVVSETAAMIGDPAVRNKGTIGGSLAHGDPAADMPATAIALGAELVCQGKKKRTVKVDDWFTGIMETAIGEDELLVEVRVPRTGAAGWAYEKFTRRANDWAIVAVAVVDGRVGLVNMGPTPLRASATEAALAGGASIAEAAALADQDTDPPADLAGSKEYRRHLARLLTRRALTTAHDR